MLTINQISLFVLFLIWMTILFFALLDFLRKKKLKFRPPVSFIVPCYNDEKTIESTIRSIYSSYEKNKIDLLVINDHSLDNSLNILKNLKKEFGFRLINNKKNLGKAKSINNVYELSKHDLIWVVDSDIIVNAKAIDSILARFQADPKLAAANCAYKIKNTGWWSVMQQMESNMMSTILLSHNLLSTLYIWGGCVAIRKEVFRTVGGFSETMLTEDADLAFKINEHKFHVQHSISSVEVYGVEGFGNWVRQRMRWISGTIQCYLKYISVWIKHPLHVIFLFLFTILSISFIFSLINEAIFFNQIFDMYSLLRETMTRLGSLKIIGFYSGFMLLGWIFSKFYFLVFSIPYTFSMIEKYRYWYKIFYVIPFVLIYFPILSILAIISTLKTLFTYPFIKNKKRAW